MIKRLCDICGNELIENRMIRRYTIKRTIWNGGLGNPLVGHTSKMEICDDCMDRIIVSIRKEKERTDEVNR